MLIRRVAMECESDTKLGESALMTVTETVLESRGAAHIKDT